MCYAWLNVRDDGIIERVEKQRSYEGKKHKKLSIRVYIAGRGSGVFLNVLLFEVSGARVIGISVIGFCVSFRSTSDLTSHAFSCEQR